MTEFEELAMQNILTWALRTQAHTKYENFNEMIKSYWNQTLNTNTEINPIQCDSDSKPFTEWETEYGKQPYA